MVILRALILLVVSLPAIMTGREIRFVDVKCSSIELCSVLEERARSLLVGKDSRADIEKAIEFLLFDQSIDRLGYELYEVDENSWRIVFNIQPKVKINKVSIEMPANIVGQDQLLPLMPIKDGSYFEQDQLEDVTRIVNDFLGERGFIKPKVEFKKSTTEDGIDIVVAIDPGPGINVSKLEVESDQKVFIPELINEYEVILGKNWNASQARQITERIERDYFSKGFWQIDVEAFLSKDNELIVQAKFGSQYVFSFQGENAFSRTELVASIHETARSSSMSNVAEIIRESILKKYESIGLYNVEVDQRTVTSIDRQGVKRNEIHITLKENEKTRLGVISLEGNSFITETNFKTILEKECSVLVCRGYFDEQFLNNFTDIIRRNYLSNGFVMVNVTSPEIRIGEDKKTNVRYIVNENQKVELNRILLEGVPSDLAPRILERMKNKQGQPLDVTAVESDMNLALETLKEEGYFFARLMNVRDSKIVQYGRNFQTAQLAIPFDVGRKTYFDGVLVTGNSKTDTVVIEREIELKKGDLVTSREINRLRERLISLGLFANVTITPFLTQSSIPEQYWLSFLVEVKERDFGLGEIAPGYRTDLGPKASFQLSYNNWRGLNRTWAFKTQANLRHDSTEFDLRRSSEDRRLLEYFAEISYREPWLMGQLLNTKIEFDIVGSYKRQRFFSFDADILRISPRLTKQFGDHFTASIRYQYENIRQFDASELKDGDRFEIGGITPSVTLDFRDNSIIPTKGAFFGLSWEFANPYFLSQSRDDLTINFNKLTSRNRFYYPVGNLVFALSVSAGYQRNFADDLQRDSGGNLVLGDDGQPLTKGYIPSIKVFRLDGVDNVRGFGDNEINRLPSDIDIGELRIQDTVTFVNYKLEPRYYFSDNIALGVFFDAGGLYVNGFTPLKVRTAAGLSAKLVTPVGSLDFDYGVKLRRSRSVSNGRESFGRFHLSIGSF